MAAARSARSIAQTLGISRSPSLIPYKQSRRFAGGGGEHHEAKVAWWTDPMSPSKWKEEHFVLICLTGWGCIFYGGYKFFTGDKKDKQETATATNTAAAH